MTAAGGYIFMYNFYYFYFVIDSAPPLQAFVSFLGGCAAISIYISVYNFRL